MYTNNIYTDNIYTDNTQVDTNILTLLRIYTAHIDDTWIGERKH